MHHFTFRKILIYLNFFWLSLLLITIAIFWWFYIDQDGLSDFQIGLLSSILGVGIAITFNENRKSLIDHQRTKKTFGLLRLIIIPYLKNQSENIIETMKLYDDICSFDKSIAFIRLISEFNRISTDFDKNWLQLIYSQDFIDAIKSDNHFNKISNQIFEIMIFTKTITGCSINAKNLLDGLSDINVISEDNKIISIEKSKKIRNEILDVAQKLQKYADNLNNEITNFLEHNGVIYSEFER